ncbi:MAG: flagellar basal body L-ring protein FlgH [Dechloromonas sp.]|jgi:flagellar L-ring protein precursor FlgH|nr:flagellar basal body L-ring protein FlgH [Dechloromonas sp.]
MRSLIPLGLAALLLAACQTVPPTNVHQPMTTRPADRPATAAGRGAIYQAGYSRPLFEDHRARFVGDTLTVTITESTSASTTSNAKIDRSSSMTADVTTLARLPGKGLRGLGVDASSTTAFEGKGNAGNRNLFNGTMTATVIEVLPNGNLLVSGEKQVAIGKEQEYVRVSGVVNPVFIDSTNTVPSSKIADARIEYKSAGQISDSETIGWLARFFLSVLPF